MYRYVCALGVILLAVTLEQAVAHPGHDKLGCHNGTKATVDECCAIPMLASKTILEKCRSENRDKPSKKDNKDFRHHGACIAECVMKSMGAFKNDQIDGTAFKKAVEPVSKANPAFAPLIDEAVKECNERLNMDPKFTQYPTQPKCKDTSKVFINCVYSTLFEKCPANLWTNKAECSALKDKIKIGCPYFALRRHGGRRGRPT